MYVPNAAKCPVWSTLEKTCNLREHPSDRIKGKITDTNVKKGSFFTFKSTWHNAFSFFPLKKIISSLELKSQIRCCPSVFFTVLLRNHRSSLTKRSTKHVWIKGMQFCSNELKSREIHVSATIDVLLILWFNFNKILQKTCWLTWKLRLNNW